MTEKFETWLRAFFGDTSQRDVGLGWACGVTGVALGLLAICSVLALRFPSWFTLPDLRSAYPIDLVRLAIDLGILSTMLLAALSLLTRRKKTLGLAGLMLAGAALALGGGGAEIGSARDASFYLGLDWFVLGVLTTATVFVPLEQAFALRSEQGPFRQGWLTDAQYFFMSHALVQLMSVLVLLPVVEIAEALAIGSLQRAVQSVPLVLQFAACILVADLAQYGVHRAFHRIPVLWRFHKVHHSAESMDWLAGSRLHIVDIVVTRAAVLLPLMVIGFDRLAIYGYLGFVSFHAVFIHANFAPRWRWLERWLVMPHYHHWHHAKEAEAKDRNFAVHLPWLDRLFGSQYAPEMRWPDGYGLDGPRGPGGYVNQLFWPFARKSK